MLENCFSWRTYNVIGLFQLEDKRCQRIVSVGHKMLEDCFSWRTKEFRGLFQLGGYKRLEGCSRE